MNFKYFGYIRISDELSIVVRIANFDLDKPTYNYL